MGNPLPSTSVINNANGAGINASSYNGAGEPFNFNQWLAAVNAPIEPEPQPEFQSEPQPQPEPPDSFPHLFFHDNGANTSPGQMLPSPLEEVRVIFFRQNSSMQPSASSLQYFSEFFTAYDSWHANMDLDSWMEFDNEEEQGAPPLSEQKITEIERVAVTAADMDLCSVCCEDFRLGETVPKLACSHMFHEQCIVRWLRLHDTCPKCRLSLGAENAAQQPGDAGQPSRQDEDHGSNAESQVHGSTDGTQ